MISPSSCRALSTPPKSREELALPTATHDHLDLTIFDRSASWSKRSAEGDQTG